MLSFLGYDETLHHKEKFTYIITFIANFVVVAFLLFYIIFIQSITVVAFTSLCFLAQLSALFSLKYKHFYTGKLLMLVGFFIQEIALIFWLFPETSNLNYFLFIIAPITFFIYDLKERRDRLTVLIANAMAGILLLLNELYPPTNPLIHISDHLITIFTLMTVGTTIGSITIVYYFYSRTLDRFHDELHTLAHTDSLTNISNRRVLFDEGNTLFEACKKHGQHFTLLLFDIDHFKQVNDNYGHPAGDQILADMVQLATENIRHYDIFARYGGEEFAMILKDTTQNNCHVIPNKLLDMVRNQSFILGDGQQVKITVSIGVTNFNPRYKNFDEMVKQCDNALYEAKEGGRDRVVVTD